MEVWLYCFTDMETLPPNVTTPETRKSSEVQTKITISIDAELWGRFRAICSLVNIPASTQLSKIIGGWIDSRSLSDEELRTLETIQRKVSHQLNKEKGNK